MEEQTTKRKGWQQFYLKTEIWAGLSVGKESLGLCAETRASTGSNDLQ